MKFEIIDHTGDVGVIVFGKDFKEIIENSVYALSELVFPDTGFRTDVTDSVHIEGGTDEELLLNLLSLIVTRIDSDNVIFFEIIDPIVADGKINANLNGMRISDGMNYEYVIKAVTYHDLEINKTQGYARIIFDI